MRVFVQRSSLALFAVLVGSMQAQSTPALRHGPAFGTFSNLHYIDQTGDVVGTEITIIPQHKTAYAIFQCSEGAPSDPVFVPVSLNGRQIQFTVHSRDKSCDGVFTGTITARGLKLVAQSENKGPKESEGGELLSRRASYWSH
ncbi:hypothetical protein [Tunturiibacter gelidoferens]|uniref:Uncharacterized protein n=2 Tax=Tunturiibacter gelidiferens TaxID=3069689 RepID=A0AAU7YYC5_9BACT|nr:hypothetical protein [Edaphobacter lichenicola]MBB5337998.1 hypothetical protein [Edaphobacter lichenicola]